MSGPFAFLNLRAEPHYRVDAFRKGLQRAGYWVGTGLKPAAPREPTREDFLVLWNKKRGLEEDSADEWERRGGSVLVIENGYIGNKPKEHVHYAISVHGHNGSGWFPVGNDDRWSKLGIAIKPWREGGTEIVVRAQRGIGSTLMASPPGWAEKMASKLKPSTKLPVRVIQHPGNFVPKLTDVQELAKAESLVIWCSSLGVRALVEGVPVGYCAPYWICEDGAQPFVAPGYLHGDDSGRNVTLARMAHGQWHVDEIATGEPFVRIREKIGEAKWG